MKILLANAHPYIPQMVGGAQSSINDLAREFAARGHEVSVLSGLTGKGRLGVVSRVKLKLNRRGYVVDRTLGYPVYRAWFPWEVAADVARHVGADVVVPQSLFPVKIAQALDGVDTRVVIYLRNAEVEDLGGAGGQQRQQQGLVVRQAVVEPAAERRPDQAEPAERGGGDGARERRLGGVEPARGLRQRVFQGERPVLADQLGHGALGGGARAEARDLRQRLGGRAVLRCRRSRASSVARCLP